MFERFSLRSAGSLVVFDPHERFLSGMPGVRSDLADEKVLGAASRRSQLGPASYGAGVGCFSKCW